MYKIAMAVLAVVIVVAFFLPWVSVSSPAAGKITKFLGGNEKVALASISGFQVPVLANGPDSRLMITIIQLFNPGVKDADKKSYLIWVIPALGVLMAGLFGFLGKNKWLNLVFAIVGILIFSVAAYKINTTDLNKIVLKVHISSGLWLVLYAYLAMGLLCLAHFFGIIRKKA